MKKNRSKRINIILLCLVLIGAILAIWTLWGNMALMVSEITIISDRLPSEFSGYRIAHISDLHNTEFGEDNETMLQMLSECQPDIIVITGDLIDAQHADVEAALSFAQNSVKIAPTYYVTGNHEANRPQYDTLKNGLKAAGVASLAATVFRRNFPAQRVRVKRNLYFAKRWTITKANSFLPRQRTSL